MAHSATGTSLRRPLAVLSAVMLLATACSSASTLAEFESDWRALLQQVPTYESVQAARDPDLRAICDEAVGHLREAATKIEYVPNVDVKHAAERFTHFAESLFFACPTATGEHAGFEAGYQEMDRLAEIVEMLLIIEEQLAPTSSAS